MSAHVGQTLAAMASHPAWVAWQKEDTSQGRPTKIPYAPNGRKAKCNNSTTWGTREQAEARAEKLPKPYGIGGIGLGFADLGEGMQLAGVDLDSCRDPATGIIEPWASDVISRFGSYAEISPSGTGVKVFFGLKTDDLPALRRAMGSEHGRLFKRKGDDHPPAIELYISNRFFTVTELKLPDAVAEIRLVETDILLELVQVTGPAFVGADAAKSADAAKPARATKPSSDKSRSATAFHKGVALRRAGCTFEEMVKGLLDDPETADWTRDKGQANGQRELKRIWNKAAAASSDAVAEVVAEFNRQYMVVNEAGKAVVYAPGFDPILHRRSYDRITFEDLRRLYLNRIIEVGVDDKGDAIYKCVADVWLRSPDRRQFINGVVFDPTGRNEPGTLNLWHGFAVESKDGDWSRLKNHLWTVICNKDKVRYSYVMGWMARMVQRPAEQGHTAIVMKGGEGTGKGILARALLHIVGQHGIAISNAKHLTSNFNGHLRDVVLLFADEAFFAGDRAHVGVLKSIITEPYLTIEAKHQNAVQVPNFLHVMMASNEEWVVPASLDSRRFLMLEVSEARKGDHAYFQAIAEQLKAGGYEAMLHELLNLDISGFNVRNVPVTAGLQEQRKLSLPVPQMWWVDCLQLGYVFRSKIGLEEYFAQWHTEVSTEILYDSYRQFAERTRERHQLSREAFGKFLVTMGNTPKRLGDAAVGEHIVDENNSYGGTTRKAVVRKHARPPGYHLGSLELARAGFKEATGLDVNWNEP